ncbi:MAG: hypothetical protein ACR2G7_11025 [Acidimicrobiales bacterium]
MSTESTTGDLSDALRRRKDPGHDEMNALIRRRPRVDAVDQPEPAPEPVAGWDAGACGSPTPPPPGMNEHLRAGLAAHRRQPSTEDYLS